jgi:hypothetical protein
MITQFFRIGMISERISQAAEFSPRYPGLRQTASSTSNGAPAISAAAALPITS